MNSKTISKRLGSTLCVCVLTTSALLGVAHINPETAYAKDAKIVANGDGTVSNDYTFIAQFLKDTKTEKVGTIGKVFTNDKGIKMLYIDPYNAKNKNAKVRYNNVGEYNGKKVDAIITVKDWSTYSLKNAYINVRMQKSLAIEMRGMNSATVNTTFYEHGTNKVLKVKGFMSYGDIDAGQSVSIPKTGIDTFYLSKDTVLKYTDKQDSVLFESQTTKDTPATDIKTLVTGTYEGTGITTKFIKNMALYEGRTPESYMKNETDAYKTGLNFDYYYTTGKKPVPTENQVPIKRVSDSDEKDKVENTLKSEEETYHYTLTHNLPDESPDFYHTSYSITDPIIPELKVTNIKVTDENKQDVSKRFDISVDKANVLHVVAKKAELAKAAIYGHTYKVTFDATIRDGADLSKYLNDKGEIDIKNKATAEVDKDKKPSNNTDTHIPSIVEKAVKKIVAKNGKLVDSESLKQGQAVQYRLDFTAPNNQIIKTLSVYDDMEDVLDYQQAKVYDTKTKKEITDQGTLQVDKNKEKVTWTAKKPTDFFGKSFYMIVDAKVKTNADLSKYKKGKEYVIPNDAHMLVNGKDTKTKQVDIHIPISAKKVVTPKPKSAPKPAPKPTPVIPKTSGNGSGYGFFDFIQGLFK
ncbi:fimbrial isopeptide formation D2 domain [Listeria grayi]|uniref:isopeptide-forming domain-containing fimbrial protein n=1 Tax=Listeria grayi TaxID=1641 RepID=UPI00098D743C|nr:isopeptide-forming domain-containing fimbrial protein [Listeria grayi]VEI35953.1 fimbrial isopeptide formation D2 domain [Listeria grayi]